MFTIATKMSGDMMYATSSEKFSTYPDHAVLHSDRKSAIAHCAELKIANAKWMSAKNMCVILHTMDNAENMKNWEEEIKKS